MKYSKDFKKAINFYKDSTPIQKKMFLNLISDKFTLFDGVDCYEVDSDYIIDFNGIYYQINIKKE